MDFDLVMAFIGLFVGALAGVIGLWVERDEEKPPRWAYGLSALILMSTFVSMYESYGDHQDSEKMKDDVARLLEGMDKLSQAADGAHPELEELVKNEIAAQSRANPRVVQKLAQRVADNGGDPSEVLGSYMPSSEVERLQRGGHLNVTAGKAPKSPTDASRRPRSKFGQPRPTAAPSAPPPPPAAPTAKPEAKPEPPPEPKKDPKTKR